MPKVTPTARSRASAQRFKPGGDVDQDAAGSGGSPIPDLPLNDETAGEGPAGDDEEPAVEPQSRT